MRRRFRSFDWRFHEDPVFSELSPLEQIVALRLWGASDDEGRQRGDDDSLMMNALPRLPVPRDEALAAVDRLVDLDEILIYEREDEEFLQMLGWKDSRSWQCAAYHAGSAVKSEYPPPPRGTMYVRKRPVGRPRKSKHSPSSETTNKDGVSEDQNCASPQSLVLGLGRCAKAEGQQPPNPPGASASPSSKASSNGHGIAPGEKRGVLAACGAILGQRDLNPTVRDDTRRIRDALKSGTATPEAVEEFLNSVVMARDNARIAYFGQRKEKAS